MAPQQPLTIVDPLAWERSTVTRLALNQLVTGGQLAANEDGQPAEWVVPSERERAPNPPSGYVVSFVRFHERGFMAPASRFMRALCHHYGVELHNFAPNAISQAATFVGVCKDFLGIPVNWDLWVHLFRAELFTLPTTETRTRRAVRDSQAHDGAAPPCQSIKCPYPRAGTGARAREPRARQNPLEGAVNPRARRSPLEGGVNPRARRNLLEGAFEWATPVGCGDHRSVGHAPCVRLGERCFTLFFFAGFKKDFPCCFRGPSGLSPTI
jgi:hypothetical protein